MTTEEYASVRATPELVGREKILQGIHEAIKDRSDRTHVFYITAPGGLGKTRLLDAVLRKLMVGENKGEWASGNILAASRLVDLYHMYTHSEEGLIADIITVLNHQGDHFSNYLQQHAELDRVKYDLSQNLRAVTQQRANMMNAFIDDFKKVGDKYEKVVLAFDTVENLVYETDRVQDALGLADEPIGVAGWLVKVFLPGIHNAVVLIAGRPESPQLETELRKLEEAGKIEYTHIELPAFSEAETLAYFDSVIEVARVENPYVAERLEKIPEETRRVVHYLSEGQPFLLSLFVDYLAYEDRLLHILDLPVDILKQQAFSEKGLQGEQAEFREAIVQGFQGIRRPLDEVIRTLAWTPKGMGAELLAWLLKRGRPTEEEIQQAREYIKSLRDPEFRLSFVKIREIDNLVFLQDEMYNLMRSLHRSSRLRYNLKKTYELIVQFYEEKIKEQANVVRGYQENMNKLVSSGSWKEFTEPQKARLMDEQQNLRVARARMQSFQVEYVYYSLQANYIKGIQAYYRLAEEAFQGNDIDLWLLLRDELLKFAKPRRSQENEADALKYIDGDIGVRWIRHNIANGQYERAQQQIEQFRRQCPDLLEEGSFADLGLKVWESWSLIYSGKESKRAESLLKSVLSLLEFNDLTDKFEPEFDEWRLKLLTAYAQDITGYLYRSRGNFARAAEYYRKNIIFWRELRVESEHANTLNNLAWSLAETGEFERAINYCEDGLFLRRNLGLRYPLALSLNALGIIEMRAGKPERARFRCEQALGIFRDLEQPRGIGLASHALAESLRRMTNIRDLLTNEQSMINLELAERYAKEAVGIFTDIVKEPLRLVEAYIELGCIYREMAWRTRSNNELVAKSKDAFDAAVHNAGVEFAYRAIDAQVNLAWLYYYLGNFKGAQKEIADVLEEIEEPYLFTKEHAPLETENTIPWNWVQLGKAYLLLGKIAFDNYEQANQQANIIEAREHLKTVAHDWTLAMAYNEKYGRDFSEVIGEYKVIYNSLTALKLEELQWVIESINNVYHTYFNAPILKTFELSISRYFGSF
jgi:hypothetical protein